jgi:hypothetical protein
VGGCLALTDKQKNRKDFFFFFDFNPFTAQGHQLQNFLQA